MTAKDKKISWIQLIRTPNIAPITFWRLLKKYETAEKVLKYVKDPYPYEKALQEYEAHKKKSCEIIAAFEEEFPSSLRDLCDCPPIISVFGNISFLKNPALAIVGARNASLGGRKMAHNFAQGLSDAGWMIVSGLARGIDTAAHEGALTVFGTIAVVAGGIDYIYPPENTSLYHEIAQKGIIVSEMPFGLSPYAALFPRRNRLIAGLAKGVMVIEAAIDSGSLITVQYALDQGKDIFAVPGSPFDPRCHGSNNLLKQGAIVTDSVHDVINVLGKCEKPFPRQFNILYNLQEDEESYKGASFNSLPIKENILTDLSQTPVSIDALLKQYQCNLVDLLSILSELEIAGKICRHPGNFVSLSVSL